MDYLDPQALGDGARFSALGMSRDQCMAIRVYPIDTIKVSPISIGDTEAGGG